MALTSLVFLEKRYSKKDGTKPIKIRFTIDRDSFEIPSGYTVDPKDWNDKKSEIRTSCKSIGNITRVNNLINRKRLDALDKIIKLQDDGAIKTMSIKQIKGRILNKRKELYVLDYTDHLIERMIKKGNIGNSRVYKIMRNSVCTFLNEKDVPMRTITLKWINSYDDWYIGKGNSLNGLSLHLRTLRAVFNKAIKEGDISADLYPFRNYKIKEEKTKKRAISETDLKKIIAYEPKTKQQIRSKDYFLMSYYLMGASFVDLAYLKVGDISNGRIRYQRKKTGRQHNIKITAPLQALLDRYITNDKGQDDYILNVIHSDTTIGKYVNMEDERRRYNRRIREIGKLCGIQASLTSYVARHSYATISKFKEVPTAIISQALGHSNPAVTYII